MNEKVVVMPDSIDGAGYPATGPDVKLNWEPDDAKTPLEIFVIPEGYLTFQRTLVEFDGHRFGACSGHLTPFLYLAHKARRGDELARELLTSFNVAITDADGKSYWPMG